MKKRLSFTFALLGLAAACSSPSSPGAAAAGPSISLEAGSTLSFEDGGRLDGQRTAVEQKVRETLAEGGADRGFETGTGYAYIWEYVVPKAQADAFEHAYGPSGDWVRLFRRAEGSCGRSFTAIATARPATSRSTTGEPGPIGKPSVRPLPTSSRSWMPAARSSPRANASWAGSSRSAEPLVPTGDLRRRRKRPRPVELSLSAGRSSWG